METHFSVSSLTRFASSSLYISATRLVYLFFVSESFNKADPPFLLKKSLPDWFPPTFIVRSWESCQLSKVVDLFVSDGVRDEWEGDGDGDV